MFVEVSMTIMELFAVNRPGAPTISTVHVFESQSS